MVNKKGGKKHKKGKKNNFQTRELRFKEIGQEYAQIKRCNGNCRFDVFCFDGKERMGVVAGNMRKRVWVNKDDIVLISRWEFTTDGEKCSIVHRYDEDEAKKLQKQGHFPENIKLESETDFTEHTEDNLIAFEYGDPSASESDDEESSEDINLDDI